MGLASNRMILPQRRTTKPHDMDPDRAVPRSVIRTILEEASWAPTHGLTEPWRFRVYESAETRAGLADELQRLYAATTPAAEFREDKMHKMGANPRLAPVVIVAWMQRSSGGKVPAHEEVQAVACALQNAMLAATALGIASFWSSPPLLGCDEFRSAFGLGDGDEALALLYLGYPKDNAPAPERRRRAVDEVTTWVG
jgi:nitroreductase